MTDGSNPLTLLIDPSNHSSQKYKYSSFGKEILSSKISKSIATAIGRSKPVPTFLISDGDRLRTIFLLGSKIPALRKVALKRSFDSLIAASGSPTISIVGNDLLESASTVISCHSSPTLAYVLTFWIIYTLIQNLKCRSACYRQDSELRYIFLFDFFLIFHYTYITNVLRDPPDTRLACVNSRGNHTSYRYISIRSFFIIRNSSSDICQILSMNLFLSNVFHCDKITNEDLSNLQLVIL